MEVLEEKLQENLDEEEKQTVIDETEQPEQEKTEEPKSEDIQPEELANLPLDKKIRLENGEVVTVQELLNGYMRQDDYTRKTQEIAEIRRQLELAQENLKQQTAIPEEQNIKKDLQSQKKEIEDALAELDELDPQAKVLKGLYNTVNVLLEKVEAREAEERTLNEQEAFQKQVEHFQKLTKETMDETARDFNLPKFKDPKSGAEIDFKKDWERDVLAVLSTIDENMTIPEYKNLVRRVGKEAYDRLRSKISAISAYYAESKKKPPILPKESGGEKKPPLTASGLEEKLMKAFDELEKKKGG